MATLDDLEWLRRANRMRPVRPPQKSVVGYVQGRRIITVGPFPGPYNAQLTPFWIEPMENLGPYSPVQEETWMKGCQIAATTSAENVIAYWMDENPTDILYVSSTEELLEEWSTRRLDQLIDSLGFRHKIAAQTENASRKVRRTGDKLLAKEYAGGSIKLTSARSAGNLRSMSRRLIVKDEMDGADADLKTGEGNFSDVADARASAWGPRKKILNLGTPGVWEESLIRRKFEEGDCRYYLVPCPHCGHYQALEMQLVQNPTHGLKAELDATGDLVRGYYECKACHGHIYEHHKTAMFAAGRWEPTQKSSSPYVVSRHISSLYSPYGMLSWTELYRMYLKCRDEPDTPQSGLRSFVTLYLGLPYRQTGSRPDVRKVIALRGTYRQGTVPRSVIYLTMGADVQEGKERDPDQPARIELEIMGTGDGYRTWGIDRKVFVGSVNDPHSGAWEQFYEWGNGGGFTYRRTDGAPLTVGTVFVDSGYAAQVVYGFCFGRGWQRVYPCKGVPQIVADPARGEKAATRGRYIPWRTLQVGGAARDVLYEVNGQWYKGLLYGKLWKSQRSPTDPQPYGFTDFPMDYGDDYFSQLTAEELLTDGTYRQVRTRNEALDCFDDQTEVLTHAGWKRFSVLSKRDRLATVNLSSETIEYQRSTHYIEHDYDGEMVHIHGRRTDIMVTPDHRMVAIRRRQERQSDGSRKWNLDPKPEIVLAKYLIRTDQLLVAAKWKGRQRATIRIPDYTFKQSSTTQIGWPAVDVDAADWAEFLGWFVAEGCTFRQDANGKRQNIRRVQIDQNPGAKADRIRTLLARLPWPFREETSRGARRWICTSAQLYEAVMECGIGVANKRVPPWIKAATPAIIARFLESAILGDGWEQNAPGQRGLRTYATVSKRLADDVQELFLKLGKASNIREVQPHAIYGGRTLRVGRASLFGVARKQYHVSECHLRKISLDGGGHGKREFIGKRVTYKGKVYCATVPNGTLIVRRNGRAFIAGNCRVYAMCAADVYLAARVEQMRADAVSRGASKLQAETAIRSPQALQWLERYNLTELAKNPPA